MVTDLVSSAVRHLITHGQHPSGIVQTVQRHFSIWHAWLQVTHSYVHCPPDINTYSLYTQMYTSSHICIKGFKYIMHCVCVLNQPDLCCQSLWINLSKYIFQKVCQTGLSKVCNVCLICGKPTLIMLVVGHTQPRKPSGEFALNVNVRSYRYRRHTVLQVMLNQN